MRSHGTGRACYHECREVKCEDCRVANTDRQRLRRQSYDVLQREAESKQRERAEDPVRSALNQVRGNAARRKGRG